MAASSTAIVFRFSGNPEEINRANEIVRSLLTEKHGPYYDSWEGEDLYDLGMDYDEAEFFAYDVSVAILKEFSSNHFSIDVQFDWLRCEGKFTWHRDYDGQLLHCKDVENPYDFDGTCPECGKEILDNIEDWVQGTIYTCPECGEEVDFDDVASGFNVSTWDQTREDLLKEAD